MANEVQRLTPSDAVTLLDDGDLELTFDGQATAIISYADINTTATFASKIQTELEALSNIGSGNVAVTWSTDHARVEFQGTLADTNVAEITVSSNTLKRAADTVSVTTTTNGAGENAEEWILDISGNSSGDYKISISGVGTTTAIAYNDSAFSVESNLNTISSGYTATDLGSGLYKITKLEDVSLSITDDTTDGGVEITESLPYSSGTPQVATVTLPDSPTEGTLNVTLDGVSSSDFNYDDSSPAFIGGWTGGGSAGNWTYTRDTNASNVSTNGAEGATPLRKAFTITPSTETQGSGGGGGGGGNAGNLLLLGVGS